MTIAKTHRSLIYVIFSLALTVGVFAYLFTHITWAQVVDLIVNVNRPLLTLFFALSISMQIVRTLRYRVILKSVGQYPGFLRLFLVVMVRGFCVDLLPARAGELVYIYILRARLGLDLGAATASFALSFLFDFTALAPLILLALAMVGTGLSMSPVVLAGAGILLLAMSIALIQLLPLALRFAYGVSKRLTFFSPRFRHWLSHFVAGTHRQVKRAKRQGVYAKVFGYSVAVRLLKYSALYVLLLAMLAPQGYSIGSLPFPKVFLGLVSAEMAASLPISGIAGLGAYQGAWSLVFTLLGFPAEMAKVTSVSHHIFSQVYAYSLGLLALLALLIIPARRRRAH
jgi:uncharacterized protein (TIRG00374 family)